MSIALTPCTRCGAECAESYKDERLSPSRMLWRYVVGAVFIRVFVGDGEGIPEVRNLVLCSGCAMPFMDYFEEVSTPASE